MLAHDKFRVILTPEPSRIDYRNKPEVLKEWAWLILPVRWGFPAAPSLGSEIKLIDVGNRAPFGLAYSSAFNRTAPTLLFSAYQVRKLSVLRSFLEDLVQPWYYLYIFRTPRFVNDARGTANRRALERIGLLPRGGEAGDLVADRTGLIFGNALVAQGLGQERLGAAGGHHAGNLVRLRDSEDDAGGGEIDVFAPLQGVAHFRRP